MKYYSDVQTEKILIDLEKNIHTMYGVAYAEMKDTASSYFAKFKERYEQEYKAFEAGKYTEAQFKAWVQTQIARGEGYEKMADKLSKRMVEADTVASAYINDKTPSIYSLNHNYEAYRISEAENVDFHLADEQTVKELMQNKNHTEFKTTSVNPKRDYEWNSKKIHSALTSAILQGKSIDKLADSFYSVMKSDRASAIRNARTSFTSAQNAGRMASYEQATEMGIELKKEWICTHDDRTRDSHAEIDGERVAYDEEFSNGLMYPADPNGEPAEVYNCRCTMRAILPNINDQHRETYEEWLERMKPEEEKQDDKVEEVVDNRTSTTKLQDALWDSRMYHIEHNNMTAVYHEEEKYDTMRVNYGKLSEETQKEFTNVLSNLASEYDTTLTDVRLMDRMELLGKKDSFAFTYHSYETDYSTLVINPLKCNNVEKMTERVRELSDVKYAVNVPIGKEKEYIATHEFAHTLVDTETKLNSKRNWLNADYDKTKSVRKEINSIYEEYITAYTTADKLAKEAEMTALTTFDNKDWEKAGELSSVRNGILLSKYSLTSADEFMAEAFTASRFGTLESEYGKRVVEVINKNYKR